MKTHVNGIILSVLFACNSAIASSNSNIEQHRAQLIGRSKTKEEYHFINRQMQVLEEATGGCELQMKSNLVPFSCYQQLKIERVLGIIDKTKALEAEELLNEVCSVRALKTQNKVFLQKGEALMVKGSDCFNEVRKRIELLIYKERESDPSEIFNQIIKK